MLSSVSIGLPVDFGTELFEGKVGHNPIPKYIRKMIYNQLKADIRDIIKQLCSYKGIERVEGHLMPDHAHMLVAIPPKYSVSSIMD